ncbi:MAG: hypothetical protein HW383_268 [Candidatus Magasanikbacteria bacterium]|nr:hypothetical protein [Candidatus Magasanikbacteria bacterium]
MLSLFLIGRILFGGYFIKSALAHFMKHQMMAGYAASRGVPMTGFLIPFSGLLILLGGLSILLGAYVKIGVLLIALFLIPVTFWMHPYWKDADPNMKMANTVNFWKNLCLLGAALMLLAIPEPWVWSVLF